MRNKLGLNNQKLFSIEKIIVNTKLNLLSEEFVFNNDLFSLEFLRQLHLFLFSDLYYEEDLRFRDTTNDELKHISILFNLIKKACISDNPKMLIEILTNFWELQIFRDGNTRTLLGYLTILNKVFILNLNIDLNGEINSKPSELRNKTFVNQKQLTKTK